MQEKERYVIKDRWIFDTKLNKNIHSIDCYEEKNVLDIMNGQNERIAELEAKLAESEDCNNILYKCLTEKDIEIETKKEEIAELEQQLQSQPAEIVEKIKEFVDGKL